MTAPETSTSPPLRHQGRCLCGGVQFEITGPLAPIQVCHCGQCRQAQGGPFATNVPVPEANYRLLQGAELINHYESSPGKVRAFCRQCGSPLFSKRSTLPGVLRVRAGLLQGPVATQLGWHIYTGSKANWWPLDDGLPHYEVMPPTA
jgi:hypothetical protein